MSKEDMIIEAFYWNRSLTAKDYDGNPAPWYADRRLVIEGAEPAVIDPRTGYPIVGLDKPAKIALVPTWKNIEEWQKQTVNIAAIIASAVPNAPTAEGYIDSKGKYVPGCNG